MNIDKIIPIPDAKSQPNWADTIKKMEPGDSVLVETPKLAKGLAQALRNQGFQQVTRRVEGGYRVWKK